ncbi:DUF86 domain-containing protein [Synergistales bacterium]|nr:DUF86 domain-containing protein [Synergistales bacterium]
MRKIIRYCNEISEASEHFNHSFEALKKFSVYKNAVAMCVLQIGELTALLSDEFKANHADVPWQDIRGMRNIAAHHYGSFSIEFLWDTIENDIPYLREFCVTNMGIMGDVL